MVLAHWYSRAAFGRCYSGATCHTSRLGENQLEALESAGPARRGLPRDRRVRRRHPAARSGGGGGPGRPTPSPTELPTVIATADIPLGTRDPGGPGHGPGQGRRRASTPTPSATCRRSSARSCASRSPRGAADHRRRPYGRPQGQILNIETARPASARMAVQVDQVTGVGTVIKTGDYVDMVVGFTADQFPVITVDPAGRHVHRSSRGLNSTSVKLLLQGMQVLGTLLPPPTAQRPRRADASRGEPGHGADRPAGDRDPVGHPAAGRGHQVRPAGRHRSPWSCARRTTSSTRRPTSRSRTARAGHHHRHHPQDPRRQLRRPAAGARRDRPPDATSQP